MISGSHVRLRRAARSRGGLRACAAALCLLLCAHAGAAGASTAQTAAFAGRTITAITIDTTVPFGADDLHRVTGLRAGAAFDPRAIRLSLDQLYATGLFAGVAVEADETTGGVALTYRLRAKQWIRQVTITGTSLAQRRLHNATRLGVGDEFIPERWQEALARLIQFYAREGFLQTRLTPRVDLQPDGVSVHLNVAVREGAQATIAELSVKGRLGLSKERVRELLILTPGAPYSAIGLEERLKRLQETYLEETFLLARIETPAVRYDRRANRVAIALTIDAGPPIDVRFPGNPYWSDARLQELVLLQSEQSLEEDVLDASALRIQHHLQDDGYLAAAVTAARKGDPAAGAITVTFRILAGPRFEVGELRLVGPRTFAPKELLALLAMRPRFLDTPHFDPAEWENDLERLRRHYREHGFLNVQVTDERQLRPDDASVDLTVTIEEGRQALVTGIAFSGYEHVPESLLARTVASRVGGPYNPVQARADRLGLLALYAGKGYVDANIVLEPALNEDQTEAALRFIIVENDPVFVGQIFVEGNEQTKERILRRELLIHTGDPYDYEKILTSRHRVARLGLFQSVRLEPIEAKSAGPVRDLRLSVAERPAGSVEFGVGVASEEKFRGFLQLSYRNLGGTSRRISVRGEADFIEQRYSASYVEPWLLGLPVDLRLTGLFEVKEEVTFDRRSYGGTAAIDKYLTERLKASLLYRYSHNIYNIPPGSTLPPDEQDRVNIGSVTPALILDLRDDAFNPRSGSLHGIAVEDAALFLGSEVQFVKVTASSGWFFSLHPALVLALSGRAGVAKQFGDTTLVPLGERFYLGGRSTVRGYEQDTLGVLRLTPDGFGNFVVDEDSTLTATGDPIGGNAMFVANVEARIALPKNFGLVLFVDGGNVWSRLSTVRLSEMKFSVGTGIRYNTPIGPLRVDWGYKLNREDILRPNGNPPPPNINIDESAYEIHFTLGNAF